MRQFLMEMRVTIWIALLSCVIPAAAYGQNVELPGEPRDEELTVEALQARVKEVESAEGVEEARRTKLVEWYTRALESARTTGEFRNKVSEFEKIRQDAPGLIESIRAELAVAPPEVTPQVPPVATVSILEQFKAQAEADAKAEQDRLTELEHLIAARAERRTRLPEETAAARKKLDGLLQELLAPPFVDEPPEMAEARRLVLFARKREAEAQLAVLEQELLSAEAREELRTAQRDQAARRVARAQKLVQLWGDVVNERRHAEVEAAKVEALRLRRDAAQQHLAIRKLAEYNAALVERRALVAGNIETGTRDLATATDRLNAVRTAFERVSKKVEVAGLTNAIGHVLRKQRRSLPDVSVHRRNNRARQGEITGSQLYLLELTDERSDLADVEAEVAAVKAEAAGTLEGAELGDVDREARDLLEKQRSLLQDLYNDYDAYLVCLEKLDETERQLIGETTRFLAYIDEHILWIRSSSWPGLTDVRQTVLSLAWMLDATTWRTLVADLLSVGRVYPTAMGIGLVVWLALLVGRPRLVRRMTAAGEIAARGTNTDFLPTARALFDATLIAALWPSLAWGLAQYLKITEDAPELTKAIATGLQWAASVGLMAELLRQVCRPKGLGEAHFGWSVAGLRLVRRHLAWFLMVAPALVFLVTMSEARDDETARNTLGRFAFISIELLLASFVYLVLRPSKGIWRSQATDRQDSWAVRLRGMGYPALILLPLSLAGAAIVGYYYSATQVAVRMHITVWVVFWLVLLKECLLHWLLLARRRIALDQYRKRRAAAQAEVRESGTAAAEPLSDESVASGVDLSAISEQARALIRSFFGLALIVGLWWVWVDMLPALGILRRVVLWSTTVTEPGVVDALGQTVQRIHAITLMDVGLGGIALLMTFIAGKNLPALLGITVLQRLPLAPSGRYAVMMISRYVITIVGLVTTFSFVGITWSKVQWLAAAITVGLGFGLQEIFANFVSGLILLFERPIRVGDIVTVGTVEGKVTRIQMRATTIVDWDRRELIVPNKEFITGQLINWTLSDPVTRGVVSVGLAYGSDTALVRELLLKIARQCDQVLSDPAPVAVFKKFGDSTLDFELRVYIPNRELWPEVSHRLHEAIDQEFRRAGLEIAFPQRDVHIRTVNNTVRSEDFTTAVPERAM